MTRLARELVFATTRSILTLGVLSTLALIAIRSAHAQTETVIYNFPAGYENYDPQPHLTLDGAGNLYGVSGGGTAGFGTVFELSPNGGGGWKQTTLYNFCSAPSCADGAWPSNYVIFDSRGNLYGITQGGGAYESGAMFELSPAGGSWTETVLYNFNDWGISPDSGLVMDQAGNLYGTCCGSVVVYELSPSGGGWTGQVIYPFYRDGWAGVTMNAVSIFGTSDYTAFELSPDGSGGWNSTVIHNFAGSPKDGDHAEGTPVFDYAGNLYGTTQYGGAHNYGTVYKLSPVTSGKKKGTWKEKVLHSFKVGAKDGIEPWAGVVFDSAGNIYGTTQYGGKYNYGTIFELVAPVGKGTYKEKILWNFNGTDGANPSGSLIFDGAGNLYGTTDLGGSSGNGVVFELTP